MKLLLTSYHIGHHVVGWHSLPPRVDGIPPLSFKESSKEYFPDFSALLFCEKLIMDEGTFDCINGKTFSMLGEEYRSIFVALHSEGFLELKHYWGDLTENEALLEQMLHNDLEAP